MSFWKRLFNGIGTVVGVLVDTTKHVINEIRSGYEAYKKDNAVRDEAITESEKIKERLRVVNDEILFLRNRRMGRGSLSDQERRQWQILKNEREELLYSLNKNKEVSAVEKFLDSESLIQKIEIELETTHVLQYNAFADTLNKKCPKCGRQMKLQWSRDVKVAKREDFFWACTGWYSQGICNYKEKLKQNDYGLMTDTSAPEFKMTADDFGVIITDPGTEKIIATRIDDLQSDLNNRNKGVKLAACPVHGEHMTLRTKSNSSGLLDAYFLACPYWLPRNEGCPYMEKLKSGPQLAALLKSEQGRGIL
jgi:ssDNA-binding Zn-finger/Zn-ribbon topoisomerase 1